MFKKRYVKRILASVLAAAMIFTSAIPGTGSMSYVQAASEYTSENLLADPDFEDGTFSTSEHVGTWYSWQNSGKSAEEHQSGETSGKFSGNDAAIEQDVTGLQNGMTYVFSVWAKLSGEGTSKHYVGIKNYGGQELKKTVTSAEWTKYDFEFVPTNGQVRVYGWVESLNGLYMYIDNASLTLKSDLKNVTINNGTINVAFNDSFDGTVAAGDFSATYSTSADSDAKALALTAGSLTDAKTLALTFDPVEAIAVEQTVTVNLTYKGQTIVLDYTVAASGEEIVTAEIDSVSAANGSVSVALTADPTVRPEADDFTWQYQINGGELKTLSVYDFAYDKDSKTVTAAFDPFRGLPGGDRTVTIIVTCNANSVQNSFTVAQGTSNTYYVSTSGNDANDGLSETQAFATIDKLNTLTFIPGDQILFKKGDTFTGCFKPQGSGEEGAPIIIGTYGSGDARPVLQPGSDWNVPYIMSANAMVRNPQVNYVLQFYNVEYWEVSGLEIADPDDAKKSSSVYRSGITIQGEDIGTLEHFYIDDVIVHGFHGPDTNIGKTSGGITMNVITNPERDITRSVPTQINDIRVTNCEIYNVGRSGINFLTPWSWRNDEKWGAYFDYGTRGYDYLPYENFYMANNYIHDVIGDGTIIDNCANAVCESNLVTRCCLGNGAAVGLFNWNSDDTTFQFNEVFDIRPGRNATQANDNQGIEIDALNDRTWVQYNYVHDNYGGFMMLCNVGDNYRSFDGIIRYNISQNDYAHSRQGFFDIYAANFGTEVYNNTFYMTERTLKPGTDQIFLFSAAGAYDQMKFYNNIFYYKGTTAGKETAAANTFGEGVIDWKNNIFYGFKNCPSNASNITADPMLADIGSGTTGQYPGNKPNLTGYYLTEGSPAINAGIPVENNGGCDYFGNEVTGIPDIGAYESGSRGLTVISKDFAFNQQTMSVTIDTNDHVTAAQMLTSLITEDGVTVTLKRGSAILAGGVRLADGDVVTASLDGKSISYRVAAFTSETDNTIPVSDMTAAAGSQEDAQSNDVASNVLDGNTGTIWHTAWSGSAPEDRYITIGLSNDYEVTGYVYTPRADSGSGGVNGIITKYEIYTSNDNATWTKAAEGDWTLDSEVKTVTFDQPIQAKYFKLLAVESKNNFASASEIRLKGTRIYSDTTAPAAPKFTVSEITETTAALHWTASDADTVEYQLMDGDTMLATFDADTTSYIAADLRSGTTYTFSVYAVDEAGNRSEAGTVTFTTITTAETLFTVTVNGEVAATGAYNTKVTITAPSEEGFAGWMLNGAIISKAPTYSFYLAGDMDFTACYEEVTELPAAMLAGTQATKTTEGKASLKFVAQLAVPDDYHVVDAGLLWLTNDNETTWGTETAIADGVKNTPVKAMNSSYQFSVTINGVPQGRFVRGVIYAKVTNGTDTYYYSNEAKLINN